MDTNFKESEHQLRKEVRDFIHEQLPEHWAGIYYVGNTKDSFRVTEEMGRRRWLTRAWPKEYGGAEASIWEQIVMQEELWSHHEPRAGQYMGVNWIGPALMRFGTPLQQKTLLPEIAGGTCQWAQLFSETGAGTDLAALQTTAVREGDEFVINGEKVWTSYADIARRGFLLARSQPGSKRRNGLSVLLLDMNTPGIEVREIPSVLGYHRLHQVRFDNVRVPASGLLGQENEGWRVAMTALSFERTGNARYARSTRMLGFVERLPEAKEEPIQERIAEALAFGYVAERMNYMVGSMKERNEIPTWQGSGARICSVLHEQEVADIAERVLGSQAHVAYDDENATYKGELEAFVVRDSPMCTIGAGSYEIQQSVVAEFGLDLPRSR